MACPILCPSCGNGLSEVYEFIVLAKAGFYKLTNHNKQNIDIDKLDLCPDVNKPIGFILDAAGLNLICCRMHILGVTNYNTIYV
jgi:DNA-directed RNA polymerase subunit N (RpoN/RPB10)